MGLVNDAVDAFVAKNTRRENDKRWHPSQISAPCPRSSVLMKRGVPVSNHPDLAQLKVFAIGTTIHQFIQEAMKSAPGIKRFIPEVPLFRGDITGAADGLTEYEDDSWELLEIKSIKEGALNYAIPKKEHRIQAGTYCWILRSVGSPPLTIPPLGDKLRRIRFAYVSKNMDKTIRIEERVEEYTPELEEGVRSRLQYLRSLVDQEQLPRINEKSSWYIPYCPYKGSGYCCGDREV